MWIIVGVWCAAFSDVPVCSAVTVDRFFDEQQACEQEAVGREELAHRLIVRMKGRPFFMSFGCIRVAGTAL